MPSRVQASPCPASRSCSRSASARAANAATSTRSSGSSWSSVTVQVGRRLPDGERPVVAPGGQPVGERPVEAEPGQHVAGGQRGEVAQGPHPEPAQQVGQGRAGPSASTGSPARKPGVPPGGDDLPGTRAASPAAKTPSAMPTWLSTAQAWATCSTIRSAAASSPPK